MKINTTLDSLAKPFSALAPWLLRLSLGIAFFIHGYGKFPLPPEKWSDGLEVSVSQRQN